MEELLVIGKIGGTHHLKGAVKLYSNVGEQIFNIEGSKVIVELSEEDRKILTVKEVSPLLGDKWIIEFEEITNKTDAGKLIKAFVKVRRDLLGVEEDEYLLNDLLEMSVIDQNGVLIGKVENIFDTAAHEILEVESEKYEAMIPNIDEFVKKIDFEKKEIYVELIEGMLEIK
ncbi:MAG: 16S rRNA processing protein RimM [Fusobacteriaceae bacterium]|nr:16S rRNA processing protein RimM [Fusobacteriaceae bacterium]MBP6322403.1 16S rRNA processing protein RimM [Fusobacteriaceae bacterium]MBP9510373.1 16S rRNA processing protein RimM [Fusobacteriaceae bacterium]